MPLAVGASSKVLVAYAPPDVQWRVLNDPAWPKTVDKGIYMEQLQEIRHNGYATSSEEREEGAAAISVPLFTVRGEMVAALSVSGPSNRLTGERMKQSAPIVIEAARRMGNMLQ